MSTHDEVADHSWQRLFELVREYDIGLFAGAGLSAGNGMPSWESLVASLSPAPAHTVDEVGRRVDLGIPLAAQLGMALTDSHEDSAEGRWVGIVRGGLYREFYRQLARHGLDRTQLRQIEKAKRSAKRVQKLFETENPALAEIVSMCSIRVGGTPRIVTVLTTNLDALLQICDRALHGSPRKLRTIERATKHSHVGKVPLYHLHGYLRPYKCAAREEAADRLVLTESDYIERTDSPNHWAATTLHWALRECPVVFVGCSMNDELIRRALYRTRADRLADAGSEGKLSKHQLPKHFAVRGCEDSEARRVIERSFEMMDVHPLWVDEKYLRLKDRLVELGRELRKPPPD